MASFWDALTPSPSTQQLLYSVPAILGAYEAARGAPIGSAMLALGGLGELHAGKLADLQAGQQGYQSQKEYAKSLGLNIKPETLKILDQEAQSNPDIASRNVENQLSSYLKSLNANKSLKPSPMLVNDNGQWRIVDKNEYVNKPNLGSGVVPPQEYAREHPQPKQVNMGAKMNQALSEIGQDPATVMAMPPGPQKTAILQRAASKARADGNEDAAARLRYAVGLHLGAAEELGFANTIGSGKAVVIDTNPSSPNYLKPIPTVKSKGQFNPSKMAVVTPNDMKMISRLRSVEQDLGEMAGVSRETAPKDFHNNIANYIAGGYNRVAQGIRGRSDPKAAKFLSSIPKIAQELNPILTGSTRSPNLTEYERMIGLPPSKSSTVEGYEVAGVIPQPGDQLAVRTMKLKALDEMIRTRMGEFTINTPGELPEVQELEKGALSTPGSGYDDGAF